MNREARLTQIILRIVAETPIEKIAGFCGAYFNLEPNSEEMNNKTYWLNILLEKLLKAPQQVIDGFETLLMSEHRRAVNHLHDKIIDDIENLVNQTPNGLIEFRDDNIPAIGRFEDNLCVEQIEKIEDKFCITTEYGIVIDIETLTCEELVNLFESIKSEVQ